ncbi:hypothetical protein [Actinacidiphila rubida]|uniref:Uncharacterized protein n=1 Tax=Actinacidiphila rubida TaxID=310780 RepID=A0A1H8U7X5_9ACTN|nr:hypothetical protein [Actinacidiphila rubida]SEO99392.1 hypothetical protein SAMN05216267_10667 [Actinacidiphila rubida]
MSDVNPLAGRHQPTYQKTPVPYGGPTQVTPDHDPFNDTTGTFVPPKVPTGGSAGGKKTAVDTHALDLFATNMDALVKPVQDAVAYLQENTHVRAGAFYHGNTIRTNLNGPNDDGGLKKAVGLVLSDLAQGITDIATGVRAISAKYKSIHDDTVLNATDVQTYMQAAQGDFDNLVKDGGGSTGSGSS